MRKVEPVWYGGYFNLCQFCVHRHDPPDTCAAYPEGIPQEITFMNVDHRIPYIDDNGIVFKLREDMEPVWYNFFLISFFEDKWTRTEEEIRQEKVVYTEKIEGILSRRSLPMVTGTWT
jgi:hypothetical protein